MMQQCQRTRPAPHAESAPPHAIAATAIPGLVNPGCTIQRRTAVNWLTLRLTSVTQVNFR